MLASDIAVPTVIDGDDGIENERAKQGPANDIKWEQEKGGPKRLPISNNCCT